MPRLVCIGNLTTDTVIYHDGSRLPDVPGGGVLYTAISSLKKIRPVGLVARIGTAYDRALLSEISGMGIDLEGVSSDPSAAGILNILTYHDPLCQTKTIGYHPDSSSHMEMTPVPRDLPESYAETAEAYHLVSCPMSVSRDWAAALPVSSLIFADAVAKPNEDNLSLCMEMLKYVTCFMPSERDLSAIDGKPETDDLAEYITRAKALKSDKTALVVIKLGARGAMLYLPEEEKAWLFPPFPSEAINVTGCGDSFCGGFISEYLCSGDPFSSMIRGIVCASVTIEHTRASDLLRIPPEEYERRFLAYKESEKPVPVSF